MVMKLYSSECAAAENMKAKEVKGKTNMQGKETFLSQQKLWYLSCYVNARD